MPAPSSNLTGALLALGAFAVYASYDVSVKFLGAGYSPFQIMFFVGLFSFPCFTAYALIENARGSIWPRQPGLMALRTLVILVGSILGTFAFAALPLAQSYAIFFTMPVFTSLLAVPMLGERIDRVRGFAVLVGLAGVVVALDPGRTTLQFGHLAALIGAVLGAMNHVILRKTGQTEPTYVLMIYPLIAQFAVVSLAMPVVYKPMPFSDLAVTAYMAFVNLIGSLLIIAAYRKARALIVAPMQYSQILWAALLGAILFHERMSLNTILGTALIILAGIVIVARQDRAT